MVKNFKKRNMIEFQKVIEFVYEAEKNNKYTRLR